MIIRHTFSVTVWSPYLTHHRIAPICGIGPPAANIGLRSATEEPEMRLHRHQVGRVSRWHSVRARHGRVWDWCAHREEVVRHLGRQRRGSLSTRTSSGLRLQAAN